MEWKFFVTREPQHTWLAWTTRAGAAVVVFAIAMAITMGLKATAPKTGEVLTTATLQQVKVFQARAVPMQRQWRGYGVASALDRADVPARITATVVSIPPTAQAGRAVSEGQTIALLDGTDFKQQLELANQRIAELDALLTQIEIEGKRYEERLKIEQEDVTLANNEVKRIEGLLKVDAAKQFELDAAKRIANAAQRAELATREMLDKIVPRKSAWQALRDGQEANKKIAQENLDRCNIKSPLTGVLQSVDVKVGESLAPGQRVARVVSLSRIEVPVQLPVAARKDILIGGRVELRASNDTDHCWEAKVARLSPEDDASTRTMTAFVEVDQTDASKLFGTAAATRLLSPGQFVSGTAWSDVTEPRWVVPRRSIRAGRVLVVTEGVITSRPVTIDFLSEGPIAQLGVPDDQWAVLASDSQPLKAGDLIVLNASIAVRDGDKIEPLLPKAELPVAVPAPATKATAEKVGTRSITP